MFQTVLFCKFSHEIKNQTLGSGERHEYRQMCANILYMIITEFNQIKYFCLLYVLKA